MDRILIETSDGHHTATLHPDESLYEHMSADEIIVDKLRLSSEEKQQKSVHSSKQSRTRINADNITAAARQEQVSITKNQANTQDIRENRQVTKDYENSEASKRNQNALSDSCGSTVKEDTQAPVDSEAPKEKTSDSINETTNAFRQLRRRKKSKK